MNPSLSWQHRWFGVWSEYGPSYAKCPSALDFVDYETNKQYPLDILVSYLRDCPVVATTSRSNFPNPFTGARKEGSISYRTNGTWVWLDDLADYVESNGLCIPDQMLLDIKAVNFVAPAEVSEDVAAHLEWPPV